MRRLTVDRLQHLTATEKRALSDFISRLRDSYAHQVLDVRLFGSKARGDYGPESDMDLLILVANRDPHLERGVSRLGSEIDLQYGVVLSEITMSQARFEWHRRHRAPFYRNLMRESVSLWTSTTES